MDPKSKPGESAAAEHQKVAVQAAVAADQQKATVTAVPVPAPEPEPKTFAGKIGWLSRRFDDAVSDKNGEEIGGIYAEVDKLKASNPAEETAHKALVYRLHHFAPRKLHRIKEIEAALDGATGSKSRSVEHADAAPPEHPAVTKAKAALAELDAEHANFIPIPQDDEALDALTDKMAKVKPAE